MSEMSLDEIMSGRGGAASEPVETAIPEAPAPAAPADGTARDDKGRFAPKASDPAPVVDPAAAPVVDPAAPAPEPAEQQPNGFVPVQAMDAERSKRKALEERYEKDMREMRERLDRLSQPAQPAEPQAPPPSMFDDPDAYLKLQMAPIQGALQETQEALWELRAERKYPAEELQAAKKAAEALFGTPEGRALHQQITSKGGNPFENLVEWHKSQSVLSEVGTDPEAYKQKVIAEYLASQQQQPQAAAPTAPAAAPVLPTAFSSKPTSGPRGGPEYGGPRPLSEIMKR